MSNILIVGYSTEGNTDNRFLENVIRRTFEDVAMQCKNEIEIHSVIPIPATKQNFVDDMLEVSSTAYNIGVMALCIHTDADAETDRNAFQYKINPLLKRIDDIIEGVCKNIVAIIPIRMTEAWIMADVELFKNELGTTKTNEELSLTKSPESVADPKDILENAIRIANAEKNKRQRKRSLTLSELYQPLGQKINLEKLSTLKSYQVFKKNVRQAYINLNYLQG